MTGRGWVAGLLAILLLFGAFAGAASWAVGTGWAFSDTRLLHPDTLAVGAGGGAPDAASTADGAFGGLGPDAGAASPVAAPPAVAGGTRLDIIRENAARAFARAALWIAAAGGLLALAWLAFVAARLPGVQGPASARAGRGAWAALLIALLVAVPLILWRAWVDQTVAADVSTNGKWLLSVPLAAGALLVWWFATALATPARMRPSVPGGDALPYLS